MWKAILTSLILLILVWCGAGVYYYRDSMFIEKSNACNYVSIKKKLSPVVWCQKSDVQFNDWTGQLVQITYWEWMDCQAWCFFKKFQGIYFDGEIYDMDYGNWNGDIELYDTIEKNYGKWCGQAWAFIDHIDMLRLPSFSSEYFSSEDNKVRRHLVYFKITNKSLLEEKLKTSNAWKLQKEEPQYCEFNGEISYVNSNGKVIIETSKLSVSKFPLGVEKPNIEQMTKNCNGEYFCVTWIAVTQNDTTICDNIQESGGSFPRIGYDYCIHSIARINLNRNACDKATSQYYCLEDYNEALIKKVRENNGIKN